MEIDRKGWGHDGILGRDLELLLSMVTGKGTKMSAMTDPTEDGFIRTSNSGEPIRSAGKTKHWFSARRKRPMKIKHAPHPARGKYPYCDEFATNPTGVANEGDRVNCECCLRKLRKSPQYSNQLINAGIDCRGTVWTDGEGRETWGER
jgi:hypothetical protein